MSPFREGPLLPMTAVVESKPKSRGWIGVDLDGTLAKWEPPYDIWQIGEPIEPMLERVKLWLDKGQEVRIVTARVAPQRMEPNFPVLQEGMIHAWCMTHFGCILPVTCQKTFDMIVLYDDRAIPVETNTGRILIT